MLDSPPPVLVSSVVVEIRARTLLNRLEEEMYWRMRAAMETKVK